MQIQTYKYKYNLVTQHGKFYFTFIVNHAFFNLNIAGLCCILAGALLLNPKIEKQQSKRLCSHI